MNSWAGSGAHFAPCESTLTDALGVGALSEFVVHEESMRESMVALMRM